MSWFSLGDREGKEKVDIISSNLISQSIVGILGIIKWNHISKDGSITKLQNLDSRKESMWDKWMHDKYVYESTSNRKCSKPYNP